MAAAPRAECGVGVARLRKKVIRVACNQGVENLRANPNRLNQRYQTTLVPAPFKRRAARLSPSARKNELRPFFKISYNLLIFSVSIDTIFIVINGKPN